MSRCVYVGTELTFGDGSPANDQPAAPDVFAAETSPIRALFPCGGSIYGGTIDSSTDGTVRYAGGYTLSQMAEMCYRVKNWQVTCSFTMTVGGTPTAVTYTGTLSPVDPANEREIPRLGFFWSGPMTSSLFGDVPAVLGLLHRTGFGGNTHPEDPYYYYDPATGYYQPRMFLILDTVGQNWEENEPFGGPAYPQDGGTFFGKEFPIYFESGTFSEGAPTDFSLTIEPRTLIEGGSGWWEYRDSTNDIATRIWDGDTGAQLLDHKTTAT